MTETRTPTTLRKGDTIRVQNGAHAYRLVYRIEADEPVVAPTEKGSTIYAAHRIYYYGTDRRTKGRSTWEHFWYGATIELLETETA